MIKNQKNGNYICPLISNGECRFNDQIVTESVPKSYVFFAYDFGSSISQRDKITIRAVKNEIELLIKSKGLDLVACSPNSSNGSIDWFCQNVCLQVMNSAFVIADVSNYSVNTKYTCNPNVTHEIGLAIGLGKKVFLVSTTDKNKIPSNLKHLDIFKFPEHFDNQKFLNAISSQVSLITTSSGFELITSKSMYVPILQHLEKVRSADWLLAADYHSFLYRPLASLKRIPQKTGTDQADILMRQKIIEERWVNYKNLIEENNEIKIYEIFEWRGISEYFSTGYERRKTCPDPLRVTKDELRAEIEYTTDLLKKYHPKLQIVFTNNLLPYTIFNRPNHGVILDSKSDLPDTLNGIIITYSNLVNQMTETFWDYWKTIPSKEKTLEYVLSKYTELYNLIEKRKQNGKG